MIRIARGLAVGLVITALLTVAGIAIAQEGEGGGGQARPEGQGRKHGLWRRVVRGDFVVLDKDGATKTVHVEAGTVGDVSDSGFTLTGPDGVATAIRLDEETKFVPEVEDLAALDGKKVRVLAETKDGDAWVADVVITGRPEGGRRGDGPQAGGEESGTF